MSHAVALDHVGLAGPELAALAAAFERLGFTLAPGAQQSGRSEPGGPVRPFGTANRCAMLRHGYIELLAVVDPTLPDNGLAGFLARHHGAHIVALGVADLDGNLARLRRAGLAVPGVSPLERPVPGGLARFSRLPLPDAPEGRLQLIRHETPELVWGAGGTVHTNAAVALDAAIFVADRPADTAARLSRLAGLPLEPDPAGGYALALPGAPGAAGPDSPAMPTRLRVLPPEAARRVLPGAALPAGPAIAGLVVRTGDGNAAVRRLLGDVVREAPDGLLVPPERAGGAALVFAE